MAIRRRRDHRCLTIRVHRVDVFRRASLVEPLARFEPPVHAREVHRRAAHATDRVDVLRRAHRIEPFADIKIAVFLAGGVHRRVLAAVLFAYGVGRGDGAMVALNGGVKPLAELEVPLAAGEEHPVGREAMTI